MKRRPGYDKEQMQKAISQLERVLVENFQPLFR
jgi:hypothetical protein